MTSSRRSETIHGPSARRSPPAAAVLAALLLLTAAALTHVFAGDATKRGRLMDITWREPDGTLTMVHGREIRYVYWRRSHFSKPKDGRTYKDSTLEEKGLPLKGNFMPFDQCDRFDFQWSTTEDEKPALRILFTKVRGEAVVGAGNEMAGADHPSSPYIAFDVGDQQQRIDVLPLATPSQREGKRTLVSMVCTL